jgi:hypothetical protein
LLEPFLEPSTRGAAHTIWNSVDPEHPEAGFDERRREAVFYWPWDGEAVDLAGNQIVVTPARYPVVRVLFWYLQNAREPRTVIYNDCGLTSCCNTDHWHVATAKERAQRCRSVVYTAFDSPVYKLQS